MDLGFDNSQSPEVKLPTLRQDITIVEGGASWTGAPTWLLHDRFRNRFFRIDLLDFEILARWRAIVPSKLADSVTAELGYVINTQTITDLAQFLFSNSLTEQSADENWKSYFDQDEAQQKSFFNKIMHSYLFFKIPLARPQRFIDFCWPYVRVLFTKGAAIAFALTALLGLYLVMRQWQVFTNTFLDFLTPQGFAVYGFSLVFIKIIHELGHAFMARKYNVRVPVIGAAFIVLMPILYTDTTEATRLSNRNQRLMIDLAGIFSELALASVATLFWIFLDDGPLRSVAFTTATLSWVLSLAVNLNPFMRFDGYYILSDMCGLENLQERGFALAKWRLREMLFGVKKTAPEVLPKNWRRLVILHAWGTWIYRFFLFLGIALIVYAFFIKIIGILLFIVEIFWFIFLPIWRELVNWWKMRSEIMKTKRSFINAVIMCAILGFFFVPWSSKVDVPAVLQHPSTTGVYSNKTGQIITHYFVEGKSVKAGQVLGILYSPDLESEIILSEKRIALVKARLARSSADHSELSLLKISQKELASELKQREGLKNQQQQLVIKAPISGVLTNVDSELATGLWINSSKRLALIKSQKSPNIVGLIGEENVDLIKLGDSGKFIPNSSEWNSVTFSVQERGNVAMTALDQNYLADIYGGQIAVLPTQDEFQTANSIELRDVWFPVTMKAEENEILHLDQVVPGLAIVDGESRSFAGRTLRRIASVLIREFGF